MEYDRVRLIRSLVDEACKGRETPSAEQIELAKAQFAEIPSLDLVTLLVRVSVMGERGGDVAPFTAACRILYSELTLVASNAA